MPKVSKKDFDADSFACIAQQRDVWIFHLFQTQKEDHCILFNGDRPFIYDGAELYPLELNFDPLSYCGGPRFLELNFLKVRELVCQSEVRKSQREDQTEKLVRIDKKLCGRSTFLLRCVLESVQLYSE